MTELLSLVPFIILIALVLYGGHLLTLFVIRSIKRNSEERLRRKFEASRLAPHPPEPQQIISFKPPRNIHTILFADSIIECSCCDKKTCTPFHPDPRMRWMVDMPLPFPNEYNLEKLNACPDCVKAIFDLPDTWYDNLEVTEQVIRDSVGKKPA